MPKKLPDIQNKILDIAECYFIEYGFEKTDMRQIASDADIAIGTIYLHFQSKENLYLQTIKRRWKNTINKIDSISKQDGEPQQLLCLILQELVNDMPSRGFIKTIWTEIGSIHHPQDGERIEERDYSNVHNQISHPIGIVLEKIALSKNKDFEHGVYDQLGKFAFVMAIEVCMHDTADLTMRIDLIVDVLTSFIEHRNI